MRTNLAILGMGLGMASAAFAGPPVVSTFSEASNEIRTLSEHFTHQHLMPALGGMTGLVDVPVAGTVPASEWVLTLQHENMTAGAGYWPLVYKSVEDRTETLHASYGLSRGLEATVSLELWDRDLHYFDPVSAVDPIYTVEGKLFAGAGLKWVAPEGHLWGKPFAWGAGFKFQPFARTDRDITELHEYERFSHAYGVASWRPTSDLFFHATLKWVIYDFGGNRPPSGSAPGFVGFSVPASWLQPGLAAEYYFTKELSVFGEYTRDADVDFIGIRQNAVNAGVRWQGSRMGVGVFGKRLDHRDLDYYGAQASLRL
jgi:hypothetical protein